MTVDFGTVDLKDRAQLQEAYYQAGSQQKLADALTDAGRPYTRAGIKDLLQRNRIKPPLPPQPEDAPRAEAIKELLEYFQNREVPYGRPPVSSTTGHEYAVEILGFDPHAPLHHEGAWEVFLATIDKIKPDGVTLGGDVLDLAMISTFIKRPSAIRQLQADLDWASEHVFARVNTVAPDAVKTLLLGNHEGERWERYLWSRCPEIAELRVLKMENLLELDKLGWRFEPDGYELVPDILMVEHGDRHTSTLGGGSAMSARKEMIDTSMSGLSGHTHKLGKFWRNDNAGYRVWLECGCLCDQVKMREHRVTARKRGHKKEDWHLGFAIVYHHVGGESFAIIDISILTRGKKTFAIVNGEEICA